MAVRNTASSGPVLAAFPVLGLDGDTDLVNLGDLCDNGPGCIRVQQSFRRAMEDYNDLA
ncbi:unnamed protein product, partial [Amoebophrya sp. A25]|eukprot:GSA25T00023029001.1